MTSELRRPSRLSQISVGNQGSGLQHPSLRDATCLARHREARAQYVDELLHQPDRRGMSYAVVAAVLAAVFVGAWIFAPTLLLTERDCAAEARPGVDWDGCSFDALVAPGVNLLGANLRNVTLRGANLSAARLSRADLSFAELPGSFLRGADMQHAILVGANLQRVDLSFSSLRGADLSYANLTGADLTGADLGGAKLDHTLWVNGKVCVEPSVGQCLYRK